MSSTPHIEVACPDCGAECQVFIRGGEVDKQFACASCGKSFEFESVPTVDEINKAVLDMGARIFAEFTGLKGIKKGRAKKR